MTKGRIGTVALLVGAVLLVLATFKGVDTFGYVPTSAKVTAVSQPAPTAPGLSAENVVMAFSPLRNPEWPEFESHEVPGGVALGPYTVTWNDAGGLNVDGPDGADTLERDLAVEFGLVARDGDEHGLWDYTPEGYRYK